MIKFIKVRGGSMSPTLAHGDYLICTKARALRPGFVIVANHPEYGTIVKRVKSIEGDFAWLSGDNSESTSTEELGKIPLGRLTHHARWVVTPKGLKRL